MAEPVPAAVTPPWLINNPDPPLPLPLARCKDAMLMAQVIRKQMRWSPWLLGCLHSQGLNRLQTISCCGGLADCMCCMYLALQVK
jgi:hypothetical protein